MKKYLLTLGLLVGALGQSMAATTYFTENFDNLNAWTTKGDSSATVSGNVLTFGRGNSAGDIFSLATFSNGYVNFQYRGVANVDGGGYFGISQGFPGNHTWLAGSSSRFPTPLTLINDGTWRSYSIQFSGTGHLMLEQFANDTPGQAQFRGLSVTDVAVTAVPEPESYAMLLAGLGLMGVAIKRKKSK